MIEKFTKDEIESAWVEPVAGNIQSIYGKVNELIDAVNAIQKEREAERFEIQEWIGILGAVRESVNIHEKQIDELQMKMEPKKCESAENMQDETLKCPFCQQELKIAGEHTTIMSCFNGDCKGSGLYGEKEFWQELIRTRKALDVARHTIGWINQMIDEHADKQAIKIKCEYALQKITALEQKD